MTAFEYRRSAGYEIVEIKYHDMPDNVKGSGINVYQKITGNIAWIISICYNGTKPV